MLVKETIYRNAYLEWCATNTDDLYENPPFGYLVVDANQLIFEINERVLHWLGFDKAEIVEKKRFQEIISLGGKIFYETHHKPLELMQGYINEFSYTLRGKGVIRVPVLINTKQIRDRDGKLLFTQYFIFNITERKKYEQELLVAKKKAEDASATKDRFISTISHEIRTPLHGIIGTADLLLRNNVNPEQRKLLEVLQFSTQNLLELINNVLDFTKGAANQIQLENRPFILKDFMRRLVEALQGRANEKGLAIELEIDENIPNYLVSDVLKLGQVLNNLLGNAIKFTEKGRIRLILKLVQLKKELVHIELAVKDTGKGISDTKLATIFQPFAQILDKTSETRSGTGLGLTISQRLVTLLGGKLKVTSLVGKGSTFYFDLHLRQATDIQQAELLERKSTKVESKLTGIKVLLAEDNATNIYIATLYFKRWDLDFDIAKNGQQALEMVQLKKYDLVLMDLQMPVLNGYEACKAVRSLPEKIYQQIPIIALTAFTSESIQEKIKSVGMNAMISKPFQPELLHQLIKKYGKILPTKSIAKKANTAMNSTSPSFDLNYLHNYFDNDLEAVKEFIEIVLEDFSTIKNDLTQAINNNDLAAYKDARHKTLTALELLKANKLQGLLIEGRTLLATGDSQPSHSTFKELDSAFSNFLVDLQQVLDA